MAISLDVRPLVVSRISLIGMRNFVNIFCNLTIGGSYVCVYALVIEKRSDQAG